MKHPTKHQYVVLTNERNFLNNIAAINLSQAMASRDLLCKLVDTEAPPSELKAVLQPLNSRAPRRIYTVVAMSIDVPILEKLVENPDTVFILHVTPQDICSRPQIVDFIKNYVHRIRLILTPIWNWLSDLPGDANQEQRQAAADIKIASRNGVEILNYIGSIPLSSIDPTTIIKRSRLTALALDSNATYDWCLVADALQQYTVRLISHSRAISIPDEIRTHTGFSFTLVQDTDSMVKEITESRGVVGLPIVANRLMGCSTVESVLPGCFGAVSQLLAENHLMNVRTSILGSNDVRQYRAVWAEIMMGTLDISAQLRAQKLTINIDTYYGLYVDQGAANDLLNIITNPDGINY